MATSGLVPVSPMVSSAPDGEKILTSMSLVVTTLAAVATIWRVLSSLTWNWCFGPHAVAVTVPWNWKASELWSTLFCRTSTLPVTASTISVYAAALPPSTSITLASKTGRTLPSASGRARRRAICCWGRPATLKLVQPDFDTMSEILPALTSLPDVLRRQQPGRGRAEGRGGGGAAGARERGGDELHLAAADAHRDEAADRGRQRAELLAEQHGAGGGVGERLVADHLEGVDVGAREPEQGGVASSASCGRR